MRPNVENRQEIFFIRRQDTSHKYIWTVAGSVDFVSKSVSNIVSHFEREIAKRKSEQRRREKDRNKRVAASCAHIIAFARCSALCADQRKQKKDRMLQKIKRTNTAQTRINSNLLWQCKKCMKFCSARNIRRSCGTAFALAGICCSECDEIFGFCFTFYLK